MSHEAPEDRQSRSERRISREVSAGNQPRTYLIMVQQEALRRFVAKLLNSHSRSAKAIRLRQLAGKLDLVDAALLDHVAVRLTRRRRQRTIVLRGSPLVWVHFPTIAEENWLLRLTPDAISRRMSRLVEIGLLTRKQIPFGKGGGSQAFFGLSEAWRGILQELETGGETDQNPSQTFEADQNPCRFEADQNPSQSLSNSHSKETVAATAGATSQSSVACAPNRFETFPEEQELKELVDRISGARDLPRSVCREEAGPAIRDPERIRSREERKRVLAAQAAFLLGATGG